ncbi:MAG: aminotransferase class IV [Bacteroidales bacterium]|nr:aminotransferase class IV [Bacteroidales bacterium]
MCQLLETILYENGRFRNLSFHQQRVDDSQKALFGIYGKIDLEGVLKQNLAKENLVFERGLFKCRVIYDTEIKKVEWIPYQLPEIRSLKIIHSDDIEYSLKYAERSVLNNLFAKRENADDILIVKNGFVTDTSFCNILFYNGRDWITPAFPILKGTQRSYLLEKEQILTAEIKPTDLVNFSKARLINAMIRFEDALDIDINNIF